MQPLRTEFVPHVMNAGRYFPSGRLRAVANLWEDLQVVLTLLQAIGRWAPDGEIWLSFSGRGQRHYELHGEREGRRLRWYFGPAGSQLPEYSPMQLELAFRVAGVAQAQALKILRGCAEEVLASVYLSAASAEEDFGESVALGARVRSREVVARSAELDVVAFARPAESNSLQPANERPAYP